MTPHLAGADSCGILVLAVVTVLELASPAAPLFVMVCVRVTVRRLITGELSGLEEADWRHTHV